MSDRRLQVFHTVAKLLSFTKAAESLHMTQPAVTFQVRQLEEQFNTRLFDRTHNRISLTDAGRVIYEHAGKIFELYSQMEMSVREITGEISGTLTLGASTTIAEYMLPALLGNFRSEYPDINIQLKVSNTDGIVSMIENNEIDLGVVEAPVQNKNLIVDICREDSLVCVVPNNHPLGSRDSASITDIMEYPFICREEGSGTREVINEYLEGHNMQEGALKLSMELGSPEAIKGAVEAGMGISIVSSATIGKELDLHSLKAVELDPPLSRPFSFVYKKQKFRVQAMEELLAFAKRYCEEHQASSRAES